MTTLNEMIEIIKLENSTLKSGNDEIGYSDFSESDYESTILEWAKNRIQLETELAKEAETAAAKQALLEKIGITQVEADLLLK